MPKDLLSHRNPLHWSSSCISCSTRSVKFLLNTSMPYCLKHLIIHDITLCLFCTCSATAASTHPHISHPRICNYICCVCLRHSIYHLHPTVFILRAQYQYSSLCIFLEDAWELLKQYMTLSYPHTITAPRSILSGSTRAEMGEILESRKASFGTND